MMISALVAAISFGYLRMRKAALQSTERSAN
jgi:hypothetical protein